MNLILTGLTHPESKYEFNWIEELSQELQNCGLPCEKLIVSEYQIPHGWRPPIHELILQKVYEFFWIRNYLITPPRSPISLRTELKNLSRHLIEIGSIIFRRKSRRIHQSRGRRNLDISLSYVRFSSLIRDGDSTWVLHLEDDAQCLQSIVETASIISQLVTHVENKSRNTWLIDLSESFSLEELGLPLSRDVLRLSHSLELSRYSGRTSNTLCALMIPSQTWTLFLEYLRATSTIKGKRLIPCDWVFNNFANNFVSSEAQSTLFCRPPVFLQQSLHPRHQ